MTTEQKTEEIKATQEEKSIYTPEKRYEALILLVLLILIGIGGIATLCYKLQNPTTNPMIEGR
jgi:hypothetical protein